jgi:hypothetical protein
MPDSNPLKTTNEKSSKSTKGREQDDMWQINFMLKQFDNESDRAAVILIASILEENLGTLLKSYLVPIPTSEDSLFDHATSPLSTFSSRIDMCHRVGLISSKFARDLHIIRRIRNSFAHDIYGCNFENGSIKARIKELENSVTYSKGIDTIERNDDLLKGTRGMFFFISSALIWQISCLTKESEKCKESELEWFYNIDSIDIT